VPGFQRGSSLVAALVAARAVPPVFFYPGFEGKGSPQTTPPKKGTTKTPPRFTGPPLRELVADHLRIVAGRVVHGSTSESRRRW